MSAKAKRQKKDTANELGRPSLFRGKGTRPKGHRVYLNDDGLEKLAVVQARLSKRHNRDVTISDTFAYALDELRLGEI